MMMADGVDEWLVIEGGCFGDMLLVGRRMGKFQGWCSFVLPG